MILSQTLQAVRHTEEHRRARCCASAARRSSRFPNFGYWKHRLQVLLGRMPVSKSLPYQWYDTPNVHLCTIADFDAFCTAHSLDVRERVVLSGGRPVGTLPNLLGSLAIYRFRRR